MVFPIALALSHKIIIGAAIGLGIGAALYQNRENIRDEIEFIKARVKIGMMEGTSRCFEYRTTAINGKSARVRVEILDDDDDDDDDNEDDDEKRDPLNREYQNNSSDILKPTSSSSSLSSSTADEKYSTYQRRRCRQRRPHGKYSLKKLEKEGSQIHSPLCKANDKYPCRGKCMAYLDSPSEFSASETDSGYSSSSSSQLTPTEEMV